MITLKKNKVWTGLIAAVCFMILLMLHGTEVKAAGNYYIQVNKGTNVVTVFRNDGTPDRAFACSDGNDTPLGTFYTQAKYVWKELYFNSYGQYSTRITGSILFHSVPYNAQRKDTQSYSAYNKLGETASHGCVRLTTEAAKWIYDNCPLKTKVVIISGTAMNDPLGKPATIRVNAALGYGWDPTDPDPANPYATAAPSIAVPADTQTVEYKQNVDVTSGVIAYDSCGNTITDQMKVTGSVNSKTLGSYTVNYSVTDALGRSASKDVVFQVVDVKKAILKGVKSKLTKEYKSTFKVKKGVTAKTVDGKKLTKKIKVKVISPGSKKEKTYKKSSLKLTKVGTYKVNYYVTNPNNKQVTKKTCKIVVRDTKAPIIKGVAASKSAEYNTTLNLLSKVTAKKVSGTSLLSSIKLSVKAPGSSKWVTVAKAQQKTYQFKAEGAYQFRYVSVNKTSKKSTTKYMTVTVSDTQTPVISGSFSDRTAEYLDTLNLMDKITAKKVSGASLTSSMTLAVKTPGAQNWTTLTAAEKTAYQLTELGQYQFQYTAVNTTGNKTAEKLLKVTVSDTKAPTVNAAGTLSEKLTYDETAGNYLYAAEVNDLMALSPDQFTAKLASGAEVGYTIEITALDETVDKTTYTSAELTADTSYAFTQAGTYLVTVTAANPAQSQAKTTLTIAVTVTEKTVESQEAAQTEAEQTEAEQTEAEQTKEAEQTEEVEQTEAVEQTAAVEQTEAEQAETEDTADVTQWKDVEQAADDAQSKDAAEGEDEAQVQNAVQAE